MALTFRVDVQNEAKEWEPFIDERFGESFTQADQHYQQASRLGFPARINVRPVGEEFTLRQSGQSPFSGAQTDV